ncbi:MAG TPA: type II toxin-antitoxin system RelE/ParE family toxin [Polyangiaceae bacterium]
MIQSFRCSETRAIYEGKPSRRFGNIRRIIERKLEMLDNAVVLKDLLVLPANRLESLKGDRQGQHSIRINDQYRICFRWTDRGPEDVEVVDYH